MVTSSFTSRFARLTVGAILLVGTQAAVARTTDWNDSPDVNALYGMCAEGGIGTALRAKADLVREVGQSLTNVLAINVLNCGAFTGGGGSVKVPCPAGSPFTYCVYNDNDGAGNKVTLGVLRRNMLTNPGTNYSGCAAGAQAKNKLRLVRLANKDPRFVKGIVTLSCESASAPQATTPMNVPCPAGNNLYGYCLGTPNDGFGNAVTVGVVTVSDAGDPYGLYGECDTTLAQYGIRMGFLSKSSLVDAVGKSMAHVRNIDILGCSPPPSGGTFPSTLQVGGVCSSAPLAKRYDYIICGVDALGNGVAAGVNRR